MTTLGGRRVAREGGLFSCSVLDPHKTALGPATAAKPGNRTPTQRRWRNPAPPSARVTASAWSAGAAGGGRQWGQMFRLSAETHLCYLCITYAAYLYREGGFAPLYGARK